MREYLQALKAIWRCWETGQKLDYQGDHYTFTLMTPNFVPENTVPGVPRVTMAAVGPVMMRVAAEEADGVRLHPLCTRKYMEEAIVPRVDPRPRQCRPGAGDVRGIRRRLHRHRPGRRDVSPRSAEWVRYRIAFYGSTPAYYPVLAGARAGANLGPKLNRMTKHGQWDQLAGEISDDLLHLCAAIGRHDEIVPKIEERFGGISDTVLAQRLGGDRRRHAAGLATGYPAASVGV